MTRSGSFVFENFGPRLFTERLELGPGRRPIDH